MVLALPTNRMPVAVTVRRALRIGVRFAAVVLALCGLVGGLLHGHHGSGSEACAVCVHARTPATTTSVAALPVPVQPTGELVPIARVVLEPARRAASTDSRAPASAAPTPSAPLRGSP